MVKRISFFLIIIIIIFNISINVSANENKIKNYEIDDVINNEFSLLYGDKNIDDDLIYNIKYLPLSIGSNINANISFEYDLVSNDFKSKLYITYKIENSIIHELIAKVGNKIIYDLVLDDYSTLYICDSFDFLEYSNEFINIEGFEYYTNYIFDNIELLKEKIIDAIGLKFLKGLKLKKGNTKEIDMNSSNPLELEDLYYKCRSKYDVIYDHFILDMNYYPNDGYIEEGNYYIKYITLNYKLELEVDYIEINVSNDSIYNHANPIIVDASNPISDELIFEKYVYLVDDIMSYKITSQYKAMYNVEGTYKYQVDLVLNDYKKKALISTITVIDLSKPRLIVKNIKKLDGNYYNNNELFEYYAYDDNDGDLSNNVIIKDLDDYKNNYNKEGIYRFLFSVSDSNENLTTKIVELEYKEEIIIEDDEEEIDEPLIIKYTFYVDNNALMTRELFRQKLVFSGFYKENDNISITSDYFLNKDINGEYIVYVKKDNNVDAYMIEVKDKELNNNEIIDEEDVGFDYRPIVIFSILGIALAFVISFVIIKYVKKKQ